MGTYLSLGRECVFRENFTKLFTDFPEIQIAGISFCCYDDVVSLGEIRQIEAKEFPDETFDSVSLYRVACLFADGYPQSCNVQPALFQNDHEMSGMTPPARTFEIQEICSTQKPFPFRKRKVSHKSSKTHLFRGNVRRSVSCALSLFSVSEPLCRHSFSFWPGSHGCGTF